MAKYDLLILDLDGTLADTIPGIASAAAQAMADCGLPAPPRAKVLGAIGGGARNLIARLLGDKDADRTDEVLARFKQVYDATAEVGTTLYPGVRETLEALHGRVQLAVATAKTRAGTDRIFDALALAGLFQVVVTIDEMAAPKPDPGCVYTILEHTGVWAHKALYVGDTMTDVRTANNAGVECWAVSYGYGAKELGEASGYTRMIDGFADLLGIVAG
jgi:phosphoglycolate phosphatase